MSGIAEVLLNLGYEVQGSDISETAITRRLVMLGAKVVIGHSKDNIGLAVVVIVSSAIKSDNPELVHARQRGLPIVRRAEMLAELMRLKSNIAIAGMHGKTTTTTMIATLLESGGFDPTVINGGIIKAYGSNARLGGGEWMVVEADESDGSFLKLPATIAVVTNIDAEHMDHYHSFEAIKSAFDSFVGNVPFYGFAVCCVDDPEVQALVGRITDRRIVTYGFNKHADVHIKNFRYSNRISKFDVQFRADGKRLYHCQLPMPGVYNVLNATAAITAARLLGMESNRITAALADFKGVNRRFTRIGEFKGVSVIDDYGHHPVEIRAVLKAARQEAHGRVIAVHQPHRYTRLFHLFSDFCQCFKDADIVGISDVYAAGEAPIENINQASLINGLRQNGHRRVLSINNASELADLVINEARTGDIVVCLGAGSITHWANELPQRIGRLLCNKEVA